MLRLPFENELSILKITTEKERGLYQKHFDLLQEWNKKIALVSRKSIDRSFENHYVDSILISEFSRKFYKQGTVYDLGSGAGFPGILFAIRYPDIPVVLYERVRKKAVFLSESVSELKLFNVEVRGEWLNQVLEGVFLARAVAKREEIFDFFEKRICSGSVIILNSGGDADISYVHRGFCLIEEQDYALPNGAGFRRVEAIRKVPRGTIN